MPVAVHHPSTSTKPDLVVVELNNDVLSLDLVNTGATLVAVRPAAPGSSSLCLAMPAPSHYPSGTGYIGATVGPVANRIGGARFELEGITHRLEANEGPNQLHGGSTGFSHRSWAVDTDPDSDQVRFRLHRPHREGGYPGNLDVTVTYSLAGNRLRYRWTAVTDRVTPVSLTNHGYWNLHGAGSIADHTLQVNAATVVAVDDQAIPTGRLTPVSGTCLDLRQPTPLASVLDHRPSGSTTDGPGGLDHCYRLDPPGSGSTPAAPIVLTHPESGRSMTVTTTLPGVQVYTGQYLDGSPAAGGHSAHAGVCLETQHLPDAVNQPAFPSCLVGPGQPATHVTDYVFNL